VQVGGGTVRNDEKMAQGMVDKTGIESAADHGDRSTLIGKEKYCWVDKPGRECHWLAGRQGSGKKRTEFRIPGKNLRKARKEALRKGVKYPL